MDIAYGISGKSANGLEEDSIALYKGDKGILIQWVVNCRDVDYQVSIPPNLTAADFNISAASWKDVACVDEFQALVDENFPALANDAGACVDVATWFHYGIDGLYEEIEVNNESEDDEDEGITTIVGDEEERGEDVED